MISHSLLDIRLENLNKYQLNHSYQLEVDSKGKIAALNPISQEVVGESKFSTVHVVFSTFVDSMAKRHDLTIQQKGNLRFNIEKWNEKIDSHNKSVERSCFLRVLNKILEFISRFWSLKYKKIDVSKISEPKWNEKDSTPIGKWLAEHHNDFVAHAINKENVASVLNEGSLHSAGELLRTKGSVFIEACGLKGGYEKIIKLDPKDIEVQIGSRKKRIEDIWKRQIYMEFGKDKLPIITFSFEDDKELYKIIKEINSDSGFYNAVQLYLDMKFPYIGHLTHVYEQFMAHSKTIHNRIEREKYLRKCWRMLEPVCTFLSFFRTSMCNSIRTVKNGIAWEYGEVVALRGKTSSIIGKHTMGQFVKHEACLLEPYENKGKYFSWDLRQEDTIVLGPKAVLDPYRTQYSNLHYIEELTPEQRAFFKVR